MHNPAFSLARVRPRSLPIEALGRFGRDRRRPRPLSVADMPAPSGSASLLRRLTIAVRSILARIDLSHFPGSCCG